MILLDAKMELMHCSRGNKKNRTQSVMNLHTYVPFKMSRYRFKSYHAASRLGMLAGESGSRPDSYSTPSREQSSLFSIELLEMTIGSTIFEVQEVASIPVETEAEAGKTGHAKGFERIAGDGVARVEEVLERQQRMQRP